jgi:hypothetical protein
VIPLIAFNVRHPSVCGGGLEDVEVSCIRLEMKRLDFVVQHKVDQFHVKFVIKEMKLLTTPMKFNKETKCIYKFTNDIPLAL